MLNDKKYESLNSAVLDIVSKNENLYEKQLQDLYGKYLNESRDDARTLDDFSGEREIVQTLMKDPKIKRHVSQFGKSPLYFDGGDLILLDQTVMSDLSDRTGYRTDVSIGDLKKKILKMSAPAGKAGKAGSATEKVGKFQVSMPSETRLIIPADDKDAAAIKRMHNAGKGINVRIMKRKDGNKVYVDFKKDIKEKDQFLNSLKNMK